ncbi:nucleotidyltransferase family protein [Indibacter alkaliphilus]|uniref:nucleotidyltransferase family protein n=1 Tax=Indibacter alkaliphilus TaxID=579922 RepID=UPI0002821ADC|nr:nucleotidyltransferase family protein [Indibacter alkaliphilus]
MKDSQNSTGVIIMAAGGSFRLGQAKQLLKFRGKCLLQQILDEVRKLDSIELVTVLGGYKQEILNEIDFKNTNYIINENWEKGMSISMQEGLTFLLNKNPGLSQVLLVLCDQPFVDNFLLDKIIKEKSKSKKGIVCCTYGNTLGVPALFDRTYFAELLALESKEGAKKVIIQHQEDLSVIDFPEGSFDVDTLEDFERLSEME